MLDGTFRDSHKEVFIESDVFIPLILRLFTCIRDLLFGLVRLVCLHWKCKMSQDSQSSALDENELDDMVASVQVKSTKNQTSWGIKTFNEWCAKRHVSVDLARVSPPVGFPDHPLMRVISGDSWGNGL